MMTDQTRPRPEVGSHVASIERHTGHIGRVGKRRCPQFEQVWTTSSPRAHPSQKGAVSCASTSGSKYVASIIVSSVDYFRSKIADVGTPSPLVTRQHSASAIWFVDVPRIWRTPSRIRLKPCTYASDSPPPEVRTGSAPPSSRRPPSVNGPPSPRLQKP